MQQLKNIYDHFDIPHKPKIKLNYRCMTDKGQRIYNYITERIGYIKCFDDHEFIVSKMYFEEEFGEENYKILKIEYDGCLKCHFDCSKLDTLLDKI